MTRYIFRSIRWALTIFLLIIIFKNTHWSVGLAITLISFSIEGIAAALEIHANAIRAMRQGLSAFKPEHYEHTGSEFNK